MTFDYHSRTEHGPHKQQPGSRFLQLIDHSHTLNTVHVIGSQSHPVSELVSDWPVSVTWGSYVHKAPNAEIFIGLTLGLLQT